MKTLFGVCAPVLLLLAACGGGASSTSAGSGAEAVGLDEVAVDGRVSAPGTRGAILVFAFAAAEVDPAAAEPVSLAVVGPDGDFAFTVPPVEALSLAFLADGSNDGAVDEGDPVALLTSPALANLTGGELITIDEVALNFTARKATAGSIDVRRAGAEPPRTPTPVP